METVLNDQPESIRPKVQEILGMFDQLSIQAEQLSHELLAGYEHLNTLFVAVIAVARRLIITCWAMLRDGTTWRQPTPA